MILTTTESRSTIQKYPHKKGVRHVLHRKAEIVRHDDVDGSCLLLHPPNCGSDDFALDSVRLLLLLEPASYA